MTTRAEVKAVLLSVEKANGPIAYLDWMPAKVTREELRVLIEAAKTAQYHEQSAQYAAVSDAEFIVGPR